MDFSFNIILLLVFHIIAAAAVSKDCTARGILKKDSYVILTFFFPVIIGIAYGCKRKKISSADDMPENSARLISSAKTLCVIAIITFISSGVVGTISMSSADSMMTYHYDVIKYDRNGAPYFFNQKVNYYDRDGNIYQINDDENSLINIETQECFEYPICYIDKEGYVVFLDENARLRGEQYDFLYEIDNHSYIYLPYVRWDRDGMLYDINGTHWILH